MRGAFNEASGPPRGGYASVFMVWTLVGRETQQQHNRDLESASTARMESELFQTLVILFLNEKQWNPIEMFFSTKPTNKKSQ